MTVNSPRRAGPGEMVTSPRSTGDGVPWSNAPLPGWWPTITGGSDSAVSRRTASASRCGSLPSISGDWSTSDSTTTADGGSERPDPLRASPGRQRGTSLRALPTWVADFNPLRVGASVGHVLSLQAQSYAPDLVCSTVS